MNKRKSIFNDVLFIWQFALDDLRNKYSNSFLGIAWGFVQPLTTIIVYWFVFQVGFKSQPVENFPFILWLIVGLLPWFYVSEVIPSSTSVLTEYSYLVQKVMFNIDILPIVKVVSTFLIHVFLLLLAFVAFIISGYRPSVYYIQVLYYSVYMVVLTVGISYIVSALYIFVKDLIQIVSIILQIIFWATPIVWDMSTMPESVQNVLKYNPLYFVVNGYRKTFIYKELFWKDGLINLYYWAIAIIVLFIGMKLFHKLKPHFADVL